MVALYHIVIFLLPWVFMIILPLPTQWKSPECVVPFIFTLGLILLGWFPFLHIRSMFLQKSRLPRTRQELNVKVSSDRLGLGQEGAAIMIVNFEFGRWRPKAISIGRVRISDPQTTHRSTKLQYRRVSRRVSSYPTASASRPITHLLQFIHCLSYFCLLVQF